MASDQIRQMLIQIAKPETADQAFRLTKGHAFAVASMTAICLNALYLGIETELYDPEASDESADVAWFICDVIFTIVFSAELVVRLYAERRAFFKDRWNYLDTFLVIFGLMDVTILQNQSVGGSGAAELDMFSILRTLRIMRLARVFKLLTFFKKAWLLAVGVVTAMRALFWAWILICLIIYIFGILTTRVLGKPHGPDDAKILEYFGTVPRSMLTMFQVMTLEGWPEIVRNAMEYEPWIIILFLAFMMSTTYSLMNVIMAVIVESTLEQATNHKAELVKQRDLEVRRAGEKIEEVFLATDTDGSGDVTKDEFVAALKRAEVQAYLREADIDVRQAENLFDILDFDDSGSLDMEEFTTGVMRARGQASAKDILALQCHLWRNGARLRSDIEDLCKRVDSRMRSVDDEVNSMHASLETIRRNLGLQRTLMSESSSSLVT